LLFLSLRRKRRKRRERKEGQERRKRAVSLDGRDRDSSWATLDAGARPLSPGG